jgi:hypothetical protein
MWESGFMALDSEALFNFVWHKKFFAQFQWKGSLEDISWLLEGEEREEKGTQEGNWYEMREYAGKDELGESWDREREREGESIRKMCSGKSGRGGRNNEDKYWVKKERRDEKKGSENRELK